VPKISQLKQLSVWHGVEIMPFTYTDEQREAFKKEITDWVSEGKALREYCRQDGKPQFGVVYQWLDKDTTFDERFARARKLGHDLLAQECLDIADNANNDWMERQGSDGQSIGWQANGDHIQRDKLRIETRLKLLAKWDKRYADKTVNEHTGANGGAIETISKIERTIIDPKNDNS